jgi:hypothetical protein
MSINEEIDNVLNNLYNLSMKSIADNIILNNPLLKDDLELMSNMFCHAKGNYKNNPTMNIPICVCDIGFFGTTCHKTGLDYYWGSGWTAIQILFTIAYSIITIITWVYFRKNLEKVDLSLI